jgi:hypothetical protein
MSIAVTVGDLAYYTPEDREWTRAYAVQTGDEALKAVFIQFDQQQAQARARALATRSAVQRAQAQLAEQTEFTLQTTGEVVSLAKLADITFTKLDEADKLENQLARLKGRDLPEDASLEQRVIAEAWSILKAIQEAQKGLQAEGFDVEPIKVDFAGRKAIIDARLAELGAEQIKAQIAALKEELAGLKELL